MRTEVLLDEEDGMPRAVLNIDTPELVPRSLFVEHRTTLSPVRMTQVCQAIRLSVRCTGLAW